MHLQCFINSETKSTLGYVLASSYLDPLLFVPQHYASNSDSKLCPIDLPTRVDILGVNHVLVSSDYLLVVFVFRDL